jgi:hypothetical protein
MGLFTWIRGLLPPNDFDLDREIDREIARRRGSNPPAPGSKPAAPAGPPCGGGEITRAQWEAMRTTFTDGAVQRGNGNGGPVTPKPPIKPQPTGGRLIYVDRDPGPAEMPSNELMQQWKKECLQLSLDSDYAIPASSFMAQRVVDWTRQRQAQSLQIPPPGADPVATEGVEP